MMAEEVLDYGYVGVKIENDSDTEDEESADESDLPVPIADFPLSDRTSSWSINSDEYQDKYVGRDRSIVWYKYPYEDAIKELPKGGIVRTKVPLPTKRGEGITNELSALIKLLDTDLVDRIVAYTNIYIEEKRIAHSYARERDVQNTNRSELFAVFGLLFLAGIKKAHHTNFYELWTDDGTGIEIFRAAMSFRRFLFLLESIQFDDIRLRNESLKNDVLSPIREILDIFLKNCRECYTPSKSFNIDDNWVPFRGKCDVTDYLPMKRGKYGIRYSMLVDAESSYTCNFEIFCDKQPPGPYRLDMAPSAIVNRLVDYYKGTKRTLTCSSTYTGYALALSLLDHNITTIGAVQNYIEELPSEFLPSSSRTINSSMFGFQKTATIVSHVSKKNKTVILLSTKHRTDAIDPVTKVPIIVSDYNQIKDSVNTVVELCNTFSVVRTTNKWPLAVFYTMLNIAGINSQVLYNMSHPNAPRIQRKVYIKNLAMSLLKPHLKKRLRIYNLSLNIRSILIRHVGPTDNDSNLCDTGDDRIIKKRGRCYICGRTKNIATTVKCNNCIKFTCKKHMASIVHTCQNCAVNVSSSED